MVFSSIGNLLGGGKKGGDPQQSGYRTMNSRLRDFADSRLIDDVIAQHDMPRPQLPMRRLTEAEMNDPIFGSRALTALQQYMLRDEGAESPNQQDDAASTNDIAMAMDFLRKRGGVMGMQSDMDAYLNAIDQSKLAGIGQTIRDNGWKVKGAAIVDDSGYTPVSNEAYQNMLNGFNMFRRTGAV